MATITAIPPRSRQRRRDHKPQGNIGNAAAEHVADDRCLERLPSPPEWKKQAQAMNAAHTASPMARSRNVATPPSSAILKDNATSCDMAMLLPGEAAREGLPGRPG
jgi:hypothetical protein